jgi:hypothetical protein
MSDASTPTSTPASAPAAPTPGRRRRVWRFVRRALLIGFGVVVVLLIGVRLYLSDERLTGWVREELDARLTSPAELEGLSVALLDGIEIRGLRLGPPEGFKHDVLRVGLLRVRWSVGDLFLARVTLPEIALENVFAGLEENANGSGLDKVLGELLGPPGPEEPEPPPEPSEPFDPATFELPVPVELQTLRFEGLGAVIDQPELFLAAEGGPATSGAR